MRTRFIKSVPSLHHEHPSYKWWVLVNIIIGTFITALSTTTVNAALPKMIASLGTTVDEAQWIVTGYMLSFAIMMPTSGWLADRFGFKRTYAAGLAVFTLFSLLCALSGDEKFLVLMRIGQGVGGGLLQPLGMAIVMREFPARQRGFALGLWTAAASAAVTLGPLLGGILSDDLDWHLIFTINIPIGVICLFATWVIQREYKKEQPHPFDLGGFIALSTFISFLLIAFSSGNARWNTGGWTSDFMMVCYLFSLLGFIAFILVELNVAHPLVAIRLLAGYNFGLANSVLFIFGIGQFGGSFFLPLYLQDSLGYTALQSGLAFLPMGIMQAACGAGAGYFYGKVNPKIPVVIGIMLLAGSFFLNSRLSVFSQHSQIMPQMYLRGIAMGILFAPLTTIAFAGMAAKNMAQASGLSNVIRQLGGSFGVAMLQALLTERVAYHTAIVAGAVDGSSIAFRRCLSLLRTHAVHDAGSCMQSAATQSAAIFSSYFGRQMFVWGIDDVFFACTLSTVACILPILILRVKNE
jgi:DHA2 family multidrug resistance protein